MNKITAFFKGLLIGAANAIPGVSGGTIAVITGIYGRLIASISGFKNGGEGGWKKNILFLLPILLGLACGLFLFSKVLVWARAVMPLPIGLFFLGLILGSIPFLFKIATKHGFKWPNLIPFGLAATGLLLMILSHRAPETPALRSLAGWQYLWFFLAAVIGMGAMVVPGISGSFVLLLFGAYSTFITAIAEMNIPILAVFGLGAIVGLVLITKLLDWLFKKFHDLSYWGILGLVGASGVDLLLRAIAHEPLTISTANLGGWLWPVAIGLLIVGLGSALLLSGERKAKASKNTDKTMAL